MESNKKIKETFGGYTECIDAALRGVFDAQTDLPMYKHLGYSMGFYDEALNPSTEYGGKRFRSGLLLMLADWYGQKELGIAAATSVELFHGFSLIHDDIVDEDTLRRGRPTVWKLFGVDHAINSGDAQLVLSLQTVGESDVLDAEKKVALQNFLSKQYLKVIEGQHLDFTLTNSPLGDVAVSEDLYLTMIARKTADLIAAAAMVPGIISSKGEAECEALFSYGYNLGIGYQLCDDVVSVWGTEEQTGKRPLGDIFEKKKTLPVLRLFEKVDVDTKLLLLDLYNTQKPVTQADAQMIVALLEKNDIHTHINREIQKRAQAAKDATQTLSLPQAHKETLKNIVDQLLPDLKKI